MFILGNEYITDLAESWSLQQIVNQYKKGLNEKSIVASQA